MTYTISNLAASDIDAVDDLMKKNNRTLGFLPLAALQDALDRGTVIGALDSKRHLVGYLLYARYPERIRLAHLCVAEEHRGSGLAARLFEALKRTCTTQSFIRLNCRTDYDAHHLWPKLKFSLVHEKPGRSKRGTVLGQWEFRLKEDRQIDLFKESMSNQATEIVIDAQILFHFGDPDSEESLPSKALLADYLWDQIALSVTDEIFLEIDRQSDAAKRQRSRGLANQYGPIPYDRDAAESHEAVLASVFEPKSPSDRSDVRHLAKTAASDAQIFVTRDDAILKRTTQIGELAGIEVIHPTELILRLHRQTDPTSYAPTVVSGQTLVWRRASVEDLAGLMVALRRPNESKGRFRAELQSYLSSPATCTFDVLGNGSDILGARASIADAGLLTVPFLRAAHGAADHLIGRFMVHDALAMCVAFNLEAIRLEGHALSDTLKTLLPEMGFELAGDHGIRLCPTGPMAHSEVVDKAKRYFPSSFGAWSGLRPQETLSRCSPVSLTDFNEACILVPIRPAYAMSLFDRNAAAADLIGGKPDVLMRWENVYFRRKGSHKLLQPPARILWYVSGEVQAITATSRLTAVETDTAKALYRKRKRYGTLEWSEIFEMCGGDVDRELMALTFAHTFTFRQHVDLGMLRKIERKHAVQVQSPRSVGRDEFHKIMALGYPGAPK